jgi:hypothetical protein
VIYQVIKLYYGIGHPGDLHSTLRGSGREKGKRRREGLESFSRDGHFKLGKLIAEGE